MYGEDEMYVDEEYYDVGNVEDVSPLDGVIGVLSSAAVVLQVLCVIHILKTRRQFWWLLVVFLAPYIGVLMYGLLEVWPEWRQRPVLRSLGHRKKASRRQVRALEEQAEFRETVEQQSQLAEAYLSRNAYAEAISVYRKCLTGLHADDEVQLYQLSEALYRNGEFAESLDILAKLKASGYRDYPVYRDFQEAMCHAGLGEHDKAVALFAAIKDSYAGEEARFRLAEQLLASGRKDEAREQFEQVVKQCRVYKGGTAGSQKRWAKLAKKALKSLQV